MADETTALQVYSTGPVTVLGFGGRQILDQIDLGNCRQEILDLAKTHGAKVLAFDLTGVKLIPSGMLGLLASLRQSGIEVHLYNPSEDVREVLDITRLSEVLQVHEIDDVPGRD